VKGGLYSQVLVTTSALTLLGGSAGDAHALDFEIQAETAAQGYEIAGPWGDTTLSRRRLTQTLGLAAYHLQGDFVPHEADYSVRLMMRLDSDFGINSHLEGGQSGAETRFGVLSGSRFVPGLEPATLDLMYGWVEGKNLASGFFGFKVGRQYVTDVLGWWSFDGGLVRLTTPVWFEIEAYGGFEQRGGLPLSTSRYESQGVWRGSHADFGQGAGSPTVTDYPSYQYAQPAPAFGVALQSTGLNWVHGRFTYRRVYNTGKSVTSQFPEPSGGYATAEGTRISSEKFGYAANVPILFVPMTEDYGHLKGGFHYDLYNQLFGSAFGGIEGFVTDEVTIGADVDYYEPTFDADSIFNWFAKSPVTTALGRTAIRFTKRFHVAGSGGVRLWSTQGDPDEFGSGQCAATTLTGECPGTTSYVDPSVGPVRDFSRDEDNRATATLVDGLGNLSGRYRFETAWVALRSMLQTGERGRRVGGALSGEKRLDDGRFTLGSRVSVYEWTDNLRQDRDATSFGYVLDGGVAPAEFAKFNLQWEHDMNRLVGHRFRVLALLNLLVVP